MDNDIFRKKLKDELLSVFERHNIDLCCVKDIINYTLKKLEHDAYDDSGGFSRVPEGCFSSSDKMTNR